jgi:hypothetical protein
MSGCYYDVADELYPDSVTANCDTTAPTYSARIAPLIASSCATSGCHTGAAQLPDLNNYNDVSANVDRIKQRAVIEKTMPPSGPLSTCDVNALQTWIDAGALNN